MNRHRWQLALILLSSEVNGLTDVVTTRSEGQGDS